MTDTTSPPSAHSAIRVLTAIAELGTGTAAAIAEHAGLAYTTVTPKLRAWEDSGNAERYQDPHTKLILWRLTAAGRVATATGDEPAALEQQNDPAVQPGPPLEEPPGPQTLAPQGASAPDAADHNSEPSHETAPADGRDAAEPAAMAEDDNGDETHEAAAEPAPDVQADPDDDVPDAGKAEEVTTKRRPKGALEATLRHVVHAHPDEAMKVDRLRKLIDIADAGKGYGPASAGAVANAANKLAGRAEIVEVAAEHATYQAAPDGA